MAVDIRFYDMNGTEISTDKLTGGHDFGVVRKNQQYTYPVVIKNLGDSDANNISVKASPLDSPTDVTSDEYNSEVLASGWQTFSLLPDEGFATNLILPNIKAGQTLLGKKKVLDDFTNPQTSNWTTDTRTGHKFVWTGTSLQCISDSTSLSFFARADATKWGNNKDIDATFRFNMPANATSGSAFTFFGFRMNCLGDEKGYLITVKRSTSTGTGGTAFLEMRKGAGIKSTGGTDLGSVVATTTSFNWIDFAPMRFKLFTNSDGKPEMKVWYNNVKDADSPIQWNGTPNTDTWIDTANTYPYAGGICTVVGTAIGGTFEWKYAKLITDDTDGKVYIRTIMGEGAVDQQVYNSSLELFYDPPTV